MNTRRVLSGFSLHSFFVIAVLIPVALWGQGDRGTINGTVTDETGAVIPGAKVEITNAKTGVVTTTETGINGVYYMPNMLFGEYNIAAESDGFKRAEVLGLRLNVGSEIQQSFALEIGAVTETVEVSAAQVQVQTTSGAVGSAVQIEQMMELPLAGRNIFNLVNLVPGAYRSRNGNISIGGGRTRSAGSYIDGINNTRGGLGVQNIEMVPPIDSMQEFKVEVNSMGAEYGRSSAGAVQAATRSGTNEYHGSLYHFVRNDVFDAIGWNQVSKPTLRRNQGGVSIGGPIKKNKTFFFVNSDLFLNPFTRDRIRSVGRPEFRTGDFSRAFQNRRGNPVLVPIHDPDTRKAGSFTRPRLSDPFPNQQIPAGRFDPVAVKALSYLPQPTPGWEPRNPANQSGNWVEQIPRNVTRTYNTIKINHNYTAKWSTFLRTIISKNAVVDAYSDGYGVADPNAINNEQLRQNWGLNNTYMFSPTNFVAVLVGFNRVYIDRFSGDCCDTDYAELFGMPGFEKGGEAFPRFNFNSRIPMTGIGAGYAKRVAAFTNFDYEANFTRIHGDHTLKYGGKYTSFQGNELARPQPSGNWNSRGEYTRKWPERGGGDVNTGVGLADFLLGQVWNLDARVAAPIGKRIKYWSGYFQDDWRVTPRLTLNLGVRYETETPIYEVGGRMNGFCEFCPHPLAGQNGIPEGAIGKVLFPNRDGTGKYLWQWDKNNIAPRFGFAYRLKADSSMVLRGGFGIFFGNPYDRNSIQPGRAGFDNIFRRRNGLNSYLRDGLPAGALDDIPEEELNGGFGAIGTRFPTSTIQYWNEDRVLPYSQNFNLTLQTRWKNTLWEFGLLGALARHQAYNNININQIHPDDLAAANAPGVTAAQKELFLPWTAWAGRADQIQLMSPNWGISNYYAATFKTERRMRNGIGWTISYTHTQWIDNIRFIGNADTFGTNYYPQSVYDLRNERASSASRLPHRVVSAPMYDLPFGHNRRWGKQWPKLLNAIAGGWQVSAINMMQSGGYIGTIVQGGQNIKGDFSFGHVLRPNLTGAPFEHPTQSAPTPNFNGAIDWLNPDAFAVPDRFTLGDAARNLPGIRGPWLFDLDMLLAKNFYWGERWRAQFRAEVFSMTNTPHFALPNTSVGAGNFGLITGTYGGRRVMEFGMRITF